MKRRTGDMCGKWPRRTVNRSRGKLGSVENVWWCSPGFVYIRVLSFWAFVLIIDFLLEFRLELLWPLWLFLTSVYDSFKYQGLAFSVFFVCLSLTADFLCFLFIPVQWLFFVAPTYVWIQYVWHTERGICLPTICLWVLFIYVEASIRLKDLKHFPAHLDLCRPFAAHCIGYPVVTWGFDIKGYISYRIRQRKQREVAKENEFYYELLVQSLPSEQQEAYHLRNSASQQTVSNTVEELTLPVANGNPVTIAPNAPSKNVSSPPSSSSSSSSSTQQVSSSTKREKEKNSEKNYEKKGSFHDFHEAMEASQLLKEKERERDRDKEKERKSKLNNSAHILNSNNTNNNAHIKQRNNIHSNSSNEAVSPATPSEHVLRLEADIKRLKADLQASRQSEAELRSQLSQHASGERAIRAELSQVQQDNDSLQAKLHGLVSARQSDKQTLASLEKRLQEERRCRLLVETQLSNERRARANEVIEASKAQQRSKNNNSIAECGEHCRQRRRELEGEAQQLRREIKSGEDRLRAMEMEIQQYQQLRRAQQQAANSPSQQQQQHQQQIQQQQQQLQQQQQQQQMQQQQQLQQQQQQQQQQQHHHQQQHHNVETELLVSALSALQDKTSHLESSLSAETRIKLDLFSALGEAKKQLEQRESLLVAREREISELKAKVTEVLAVMPSMNEPSQLSHSLGISDLGNHALSMSSLNSYLSTYPLTMADLGLSSNLNLSDLNLDPVPSSALTPSSPLTPMRPFTSKLFSTHSNGGSNMLNSCMGMGSLNDDGKGPKSGGLSSGLDPNATAYTPKALGNGDL